MKIKRYGFGRDYLGREYAGSPALTEQPEGEFVLLKDHQRLMEAASNYADLMLARTHRAEFYSYTFKPIPPLLSFKFDVSDEMLERLIEAKKAEFQSEEMPTLEAGPQVDGQAQPLIMGVDLAENGIQIVRDAALEEAARLNEQWGNARRPDNGGNALRNAAIAIRDLKSNPAQQETNILRCDYCDIPTENPWHGSGILNGVESRHIHACDACRGELPCPIIYFKFKATLPDDYMAGDIPTPDWAIGPAHGQYDSLGAQLSTRDGRVTGNAHIIAIDVRADAEYTLLTDAGNTLTYTYQELKSGFYPPEWVSDVTEVVRKFQQNSDQVDSLQGAVNWLIHVVDNLSVTEVQTTFHIGYNRAKRLLDVAKQHETQA